MYNHLTECKQMSSGSFKNVIYKLCIYKSCSMYKEELALNNCGLVWIGKGIRFYENE